MRSDSFLVAKVLFLYPLCFFLPNKTEMATLGRLQTLFSDMERGI